MGQVLLYIIGFVTLGVSIFRPWVGVLAYYFLAILGPQHIWWWHFGGTRVSFGIALFAILGVAVNIFSPRCDFDFLKNKQNLLVSFLWLFLIVSFLWGPFVDVEEHRISSPQETLSGASKIFLFYFAALLVVNKLRQLKYLAVILIIATVYLTYWANNQYLSGSMSNFNFGRLGGPVSLSGGSIYGDENHFAMLFVTGIPFLYFIGQAVASKWLKYGLWSVIPLAWHAIFLTASRTGLVGLVATIALTLLLQRRKWLALPLIPAFLFFYSWQAGDIMKGRSETISGYETESSAQSRLQSWRAGWGMIAAHPLTGVGIASYMPAFPYYSEETPRMSHNVLIQFAAEAGAFAGLCYLLILVIFFRQSSHIKKWCSAQIPDKTVSHVQALNNASTVSFFGLAVCSVFLSLNYYEVFFFLLIINNSLFVLCQNPDKLYGLSAFAPTGEHHPQAIAHNGVETRYALQVGSVTKHPPDYSKD